MPCRSTRTTRFTSKRCQHPITRKSIHSPEPGFYGRYFLRGENSSARIVSVHWRLLLAPGELAAGRRFGSDCFSRHVFVHNRNDDEKKRKETDEIEKRPLFIRVAGHRQRETVETFDKK